MVAPATTSLPTVSVVCPFYNEETILEGAIDLMMSNLATMPVPWELILVNDGSIDGSLAVARAAEKRHPGLRVISYDVNQGRGHALLTGIKNACGQFVCTTEVDCSWGDDIVHRLYAAIEKSPKVDFVIASPHMPGGGYENVPLKRVLLSTVGNFIIRTFFTYSITMNTGMTRLYRRSMFDTIEPVEKGKEFHLDVLSKALAFGFQPMEISAVLAWKDHKLAKTGAPKRKSSSKIPKIIKSHLVFSVFANPVRYFWFASALLALVSLFFMGWAVRNLMMGQVSVYVLLISLVLGMLAFGFFSVGVLAAQNRIIERELWRMQGTLKQLGESVEELHRRIRL